MRAPKRLREMMCRNVVIPTTRAPLEISGPGGEAFILGESDDEPEMAKWSEDQIDRCGRLAQEWRGMTSSDLVQILYPDAFGYTLPLMGISAPSPLSPWFAAGG